MKLFPKYVPSYEEDRRDKADRARRIGIDLFAFAILWSIVCIGILCGGTGRYDYEFYPHMRSFDVICSCIGLGWSAILTLYYFLMKPATRRKLVAMYVLNGLTTCLLLAYLLVGGYLARNGRYPDIPVTFWDAMILLDASPILIYAVYFLLYNLIYYRKSKINLVE